MVNDDLAPKPDGGPAFTFTDYDGSTPRTVRGMSLRDYFAGQALSVLALNGYVNKVNRKAKDAGEDPSLRIARQVYEVADAMLKERAK